jgi:alanine dehydrogenase
MLRPDQVLFTYLHLAPDPSRPEGPRRAGATAIAYETVTDARRRAAAAQADEPGRRADVRPGRGALSLEKAHGGRGVLLGGVPGVEPGKVVILGGGVVGFHAAQMAVGCAPT